MLRRGAQFVALGGCLLLGACIPPSAPPASATQDRAPAAPVESPPDPTNAPHFDYDDVLDQPAVWEMRPVIASAQAVAQGEHVVGAGETGIAIARAYGVRWSDLVAVNALAEPFILKVGQRLKLPSTASLILPSTPQPPSSPAAPSPPATPSLVDPMEARAAAFKINLDDILTGGEPAGESVAAAPPSAPAVLKPKPVSSALADPARFTSGFGWPAAGRVVARFGPAGEGIVNQGIEIRTLAAAPVKASGDGVVAFVGNDVVGYGGMILIRHGNGWITAYGRVARANVTRGQSVKRGELIGQTGTGTAPQLHFQLRKQKTPVDPLKHLPARP